MTCAPEPLVGSAEIGAMFGVGRARTYQLVTRADFPAPYGTLIMGKVWRRADVEAWGRAHGRAVKSRAAGAHQPVG